MVQYYNVRLTFIANVAAATTVAASKKSKQFQIRETGKGSLGFSAQKNGMLTL
jgi:hypothetical protein